MNTNQDAWSRVALHAALTLELVHDGAFGAARQVWHPFSDYNDVEARAELAAYHMDRCSVAMRDLKNALQNWHASIVLERHSEPLRWAEVQAAHAHLKDCLAEMEYDLPFDDDDAEPDTDRAPSNEAAE